MTTDTNNDPIVLPAAGVTIPDGTVDGQPAVNDQASGAATSGPIDASAATAYGNQLTVGTGSATSGSPEAWLQVTGDVNLGPGTAWGFSIDGNDTTPAATAPATADASEMTVTGNVSLNGARLGMSQGFVDFGSQECVNLTPGNTYTVLTATGSITGLMHYWDGTGYGSSVAPGDTSATPTPFGPNCDGNAGEAYINYGSTAITETIAAAPTSTSAPTISGTAEVGQTLTAGNGSWSAYPAPTYSYEWESCSGSTCTPIGGATSSTFTVTSAQEGHTIEVQVTATNSLGNASTTSSATGTVPTPPVTTPPTTTTTTPTTTTTTAPTPTPASTVPSTGQVSSALSGIGHPSGNKAITALIKSKSFTASFSAPGAGSLNVTWTTVVTTGKGKHKKHRTVTVATGNATATTAGKVTFKIHLTAAGRTLLKRTPHNLHITATERFQPSGGSWTTVVKHFTL